jgi:DNA helicase-2/ATP-dependent DNA helicase PcrA
MNLTRHEKGLSKTESRFPTKGTRLSIYSRCVNAETATGARCIVSMVLRLGGRVQELFAAYVEAKQKQNVLDYDDRLLYWAQTMSGPALADDIGGRFDHVLVNEYQDTNRLQSSILLALKPGGTASPWSATMVGIDQVELSSVV